MKFLFCILCFLVLAAVAAVGQTSSTLEDQLTNLWKQKNYGALKALLDAKTSTSSPDIVALYCSKFFYVFIQPDKTKALSAATKLKQVAEATTNADFVSFANGELAEVQGIPEAEFGQPTTEVLDGLHAEFADAFPNVGVGSRLRSFKKP